MVSSGFIGKREVGGGVGVFYQHTPERYASAGCVASCGAGPLWLTRDHRTSEWILPGKAKVDFVGSGQKDLSRGGQQWCNFSLGEDNSGAGEDNSGQFLFTNSEKKQNIFLLWSCLQNINFGNQRGKSPLPPLQRPCLQRWAHGHCPVMTFRAETKFVSCS